jgi:hypothetical protein
MKIVEVMAVVVERTMVTVVACCCLRRRLAGRNSRKVNKTRSAAASHNKPKQAITEKKTGNQGGNDMWIWI